MRPLSEEHGFEAMEQLSKDDHEHNRGAGGDQYYCDPVRNRLERLKHLPHRHIRWDDLRPSGPGGASGLSLQGPQGGHGHGTLFNRPAILHEYLTQALLVPVFFSTDPLPSVTFIDSVRVRRKPEVAKSLIQLLLAPAAIARGQSKSPGAGP